MLLEYAKSSAVVVRERAEDDAIEIGTAGRALQSEISNNLSKNGRRPRTNWGGGASGERLDVTSTDTGGGANSGRVSTAAGGSGLSGKGNDTVGSTASSPSREHSFRSCCVETLTQE
jgi:hypothetical protein